MGDKTTAQDLLLMNYHGLPFSPVLQDQWNNYNRLKEQRMTIQIRTPLVDGEATIQPNYGVNQKKKKGWLKKLNPKRRGGRTEVNPPR